VLTGIIQSCDVIKLDKSVLVSVQLVVGLLDQRFSALVKISLKIAEEFIEVYDTVSVTVEVLKHFRGFLLAQIETVVNEAPTEIINIEVAVACVIHGPEDTSDSLDASGGPFQNLRFDLSKKVNGAELMELGNGLGERCIGGSYDNELVLLVLETCGNITGGGTSLLELQVLRLVPGVEGVAHDFPFASKFVSVTNFVAGEVVTCLAVADKDRITALNRLSLSFKSEVRVQSFKDPSVDVMVI